MLLAKMRFIPGFRGRAPKTPSLLFAIIYVRKTGFGPKRYDGLEVRRTSPIDGLEVRRTCPIDGLEVRRTCPSYKERTNKEAWPLWFSMGANLFETMPTQREPTQK